MGQAVLRCKRGLQISSEPLPLVPLLKHTGTFLAAPTSGIAAHAQHAGWTKASPLACSIGSLAGRKGWGQGGQLQQFYYYPTPSCCLLKIVSAYACMLLPVLPPIKQVLFEALRCRRGAEGERGESIWGFCLPAFIPFICRPQTPNLKWNPFNLI